MSTPRKAANAPEAVGVPGQYSPVQRWGIHHPWLTDSLVATGYFVCALALVATAEIFDTNNAPFRLLLALMILFATTAAILFRRRWTVYMSVVVLALSIFSAFRGSGADVIAIPIMLFSLALYRSLRTTALFLLLFVALIGGTLLLPGSPAWAQDEVQSTVLLLLDSLLLDLPSTLLLLLSAVSGVFVGVAVRSRRRSRQDLIERAAQLEREQDQLAQLAAATERTRIAREMHDIVSHTLTVVVTLVDGAAESKDEAATKLAMTGAGNAARSALADLRRLLGALREDGNAPVTPQPGAPALPQLVEQFVRAGRSARMTVTGEPFGDPAVSFAIHRIVQEGLTNALRYSQQSRRADVSVDYSSDGIDVVVENDGALENAPSIGTGQGLLGLHERLGLLDGRIEAGPAGNGVWRLQAWIPRKAEMVGGAAS